MHILEKFLAYSSLHIKHPNSFTVIKLALRTAVLLIAAFALIYKM